MVVGLSSAASASKFPAIPAGPIVLGVSTPLSGPTAADGQSTVESFDNVTLKQFDAEYPSGILGHQVTLKVINDQGTVPGAVAAANELVADHVTAIITATYNSEAVSDQLAIFSKAKLPVIGVETELPQYTNTAKYPYFFSTGPDDAEEGAASALWFKNSGFTKIGVLSDGIPAEETAVSLIESETHKLDPKAKFVKTVTITPDSVDDTAAITELKAANPQVLIVYIGEGYGPVWQAMQAENWSPTILADAGAWYSGFSSMGTLADNAYAPYDDCAPSASTTYPATTTALMSQYSAATYAYLTNYLTFIATDTVPLDFIRYAALKEHSLSNNAIKAALESMHNVSFWGIDYNFSSTNHFGITGPYAAAVCKMAPPYAGGVGKVPIKSVSAGS